MKFWKEHPVMRVALMAVFFLAGVALVIVGWKMTGKLTGLFIILGGLALLLVTLAIYNKPFEEPKTRKTKSKK